MLLNLIFCCSLLALIHTYVLYPYIIKVLAKGKALNAIQYEENGDQWPIVNVLMAVHNEEKVILEKIESLLLQEYPHEKYNIFIGSDASSDKTNELVSDLVASKSNVHFFPFENRKGKPGLINTLESIVNQRFPKGKDNLYLLTDANVMLSENTLKKLVRHFKNEDIVLVDAHMNYIGTEEGGIASSENSYLSKEVRIKDAESKAWGTMIGPFGGCYCIRSSHYSKVPENFLVDDFYIALNAMKEGAKAINDLDAMCYEKVSTLSSEEYRRKKRIGTGNFQNLTQFYRLLNPFSKLGFAFISHKVLRWFGPFFIIGIIVSTILLAKTSMFYLIVLGGLACWFILPLLLKPVLKMMGISGGIINSIHYFNYMNVALLHGFFNFLLGVKSSIWEPTQRT